MKQAHANPNSRNHLTELAGVKVRLQAEVHGSGIGCSGPVVLLCGIRRAPDTSVRPRGITSEDLSFTHRGRTDSASWYMISPRKCELQVVPCNNARGATQAGARPCPSKYPMKECLVKTGSLMRSGTCAIVNWKHLGGEIHQATLSLAWLTCKAPYLHPPRYRALPRLITLRIIKGCL